ncbi:hypothetical protein C1H46_008771 [Malus baccata]|uniref:Uncharacterized protein n=1 Tax=Malus baccata TaxID=106549 RepID=A0A540N3K3_MALBA|nr:hypothetical protein C1H46_008771 [Malus baccata]
MRAKALGARERVCVCSRDSVVQNEGKAAGAGCNPTQKKKKSVEPFYPSVHFTFT